jgi:hypothetical protein
MTENMKNMVEPKKYNAFFEIFKIVVIPILTAIFIYYGAFIGVKKDVEYLVKSFDQLNDDVKMHHNDRVIHIPHSGK